LALSSLTIFFIRVYQSHHGVNSLEDFIPNRIGEFLLTGVVFLHLLVYFEEESEGVDLDDKESVVAIKDSFRNAIFWVLFILLLTHIVFAALLRLKVPGLL